MCKDRERVTRVHFSFNTQKVFECGEIYTFFVTKKRRREERA